MRTKTVQRHYCDHCNKGGFQRKSIERHERTCFRNPQRECPLCGNQEYHKARPYEEAHSPVESSGPECPYCLLSVLIRGNIGADGPDTTYYPSEQLSRDVDAFRKEYLYPNMWFNERLDVPPPFRIAPYIELVNEPS